MTDQEHAAAIHAAAVNFANLGKACMGLARMMHGDDAVIVQRTKPHSE